jgi:hypothetical protein
MTRGRDTRSGHACSSAAADCRAGTAFRRWLHDEYQRKSPCSRRCTPAGAGYSRTLVAGTALPCPRQDCPSSADRMFVAGGGGSSQAMR